MKESLTDFLDIAFPQKIQIYFPKLSRSEM